MAVEPMRTDLLIIGATGYTGRLLARYLASHPDVAAGRVSFALAGRSPEKLARLADALGLDEERVPRVRVDTLDEGEVERAVSATRVVVNLAGPFWKYSALVIKVCAERGVHYVDLSGEPHAVRRAVVDHHATALRTGALIVPACGLDAVPADASAFLSVRAIKRHLGAHAGVGESVSRFELQGGLSGGTLASLLVALDEVPRDVLMSALEDYSLSPDLKGKPYPRSRLRYTLPLSSPRLHGAYYPSKTGDNLAVQRTWALHQLVAAIPSGSDTNGDTTAVEDLAALAYGSNFTYDEFMAMPNALTSTLFSLAMSLSGAALKCKPFRWLLSKVIPKSGEGPAESSLEEGYIRVVNVTFSAPGTDGKRIAAQSTFHGRGDPGYLLSSIMATEAALAIALERDSLPTLGRQGGVLTPMTAFGEVLLRRMEATGRWTFGNEIINYDV